MRYRKEKDSLGEVNIPAEAYYGIYTLRSKETFQITKRGLCRQMIKALATVKKSAARANVDAGLLDAKIGEAISLSCDEILNGRLHGQFITDLIQGGGGLSMNMNVNEVVANRANEMLGSEKGNYDQVHPIEHMNLCQSTNEVILTAGKITTIRLARKLLVEGKKLTNAFLDKAEEIKHLYENNHDSDYYRLYEEFSSYAYGLEKALKRLDTADNGLLEIALGYTTNRGTEPELTFMKKVVKYLKQFTGDEYAQSKAMLDTTKNFEGFVAVSSALKGITVNLAKTASDIRVLSSTPIYKRNLINLPEVQAATNSVYDQKFPVVLDVVNQVSFLVFGNDAAITLAAEGNSLDFNMYAPVLLALLFESLNYVRRVIRTLREKTIEGITFN